MHRHDQRDPRGLRSRRLLADPHRRECVGFPSPTFTLTVDGVPVFTSSGSVTETAGTPFSYLVDPQLPHCRAERRESPAGVAFSDNGNGTGTLSGTTAAGTSKVTITAANAGGKTTQTVTVSVKKPGTGQVAAFTSPAALTAAKGSVVAFTVTTAGSPLNSATISHSGTLPGGVTFVALGNGMATIGGIPTGTGVYPMTLTAKNAAGTATQMFVLTVTAAPVITTGTKTTATVGSGFNFLVRTTGWPTPTLAEAGTLPAHELGEQRRRHRVAGRYARREPGRDIPADDHGS